MPLRLLALAAALMAMLAPGGARALQVRRTVRPTADRTPGAAATSAPAVRERVSIDAGWRFTKGDPPGNAVDLRDDVRPEVRDARDDRPADAQPRSADASRATAQGVLKPWILPTGNALVASPVRHAARPTSEWRGDVAYLRPDLDDGAWQRVDLPHDWAIAGPFDTTGETGGMGRLPSWGIGWYRRRLDIPASDAGRSIVLEAPTSFEPFQAPARRAFNGLALVIVRAKHGQRGTITLRVSGEGLRGGSAVITAGR